jgi:hypothetical protein
MGGGDWFLLIVFLMPVYGLLIWSYINPEESHLLGRRWMYNEDPELNEAAISLHKKISLIALILITLMLLLSIYRSF